MCIRRERLKGTEEQERFRAFDADAAIVVAYGLILPKAILDAPRFGCLNLHASLLPHWRGAAPINRAIMAGDRETGVSIMRMDEGLDTGPVCLEARVAIGPEETAGELHDRLATLGASSMVSALATLEEGNSPAVRNTTRARPMRRSSLRRRRASIGGCSRVT